MGMCQTTPSRSRIHAMSYSTPLPWSRWRCSRTGAVVGDAGICELINLIEHDDRSGTVVLLELADEFVVQRRLAVDVDGSVDDLGERPESGVVAPAVDVGGFDIKDLFAEPFSDELRDTGRASAAGSGDDGGVGGFAVRDRFEDTRVVVDFGVAMLNFPRNESGAEDASIADHFCLIDQFCPNRKSVTGLFPENLYLVFIPKHNATQ